MAGAERALARSVTDLGVGSSDWLGSEIFDARAFIAFTQASSGTGRNLSPTSRIQASVRVEKKQSLRVIRLGPSTHPSQSSGPTLVARNQQRLELNFAITRRSRRQQANLKKHHPANSARPYHKHPFPDTPNVIDEPRPQRARVLRQQES